MVESLVEQLDEAVTAVLANGQVAIGMNADLDPLVRLAGELRELPSHDFRIQLREELERIATMTTGILETSQDLSSQISDLKSQILDLQRRPAKASIPSHHISQSGKLHN